MKTKNYPRLFDDLIKKVEALPDSKAKDVLLNELYYIFNNIDQYSGHSLGNRLGHKTVQYRRIVAKHQFNKQHASLGFTGIGVLESVLAVFLAAGVGLKMMDKREDIRAKKAESKKVMSEAKVGKIDAKNRRKVDKINAKNAPKIRKLDIRHKKLEIKELELRYKLKKIDGPKIRSAHQSNIDSVEIQGAVGLEEVPIPTKKEAKKIKKCNNKPKFRRKKPALCAELRRKFGHKRR